ncbi:MAG: hypothetical protein NZ937_02115 [Armatimonadetes bacterium]|nr:hypothetical protein [Armatimonadota bacterium]
MEIRISDLYELIVRIVEDKMKQHRDLRQVASIGSSSDAVHHEQSSKPSTTSEGQQSQDLQEQLAILIKLQSQLIEVVQTNQRRTEELLNGLMNLLQQQLNASKTRDSQKVNLSESSSDKRKETDLTDERQIPLKGLQETNSKSQQSKVERDEPKTLSGYIVMSPPDEFEKEINSSSGSHFFDGFSQSASKELDANGAPSAVAEPVSERNHLRIQTVIEQLPQFLRQISGVEVEYLQASKVSSLSSLQNAQIFLGEGFYGGQTIALAILSKSHITSSDISIFHNFVMRAFRSSVSEPVMGIVFGETVEPEALKVAHAFELLIVNLSELNGFHPPLLPPKNS